MGQREASRRQNEAVAVGEARLGRAVPSERTREDTARGSASSPSPEPSSVAGLEGGGAWPDCVMRTGGRERVKTAMKKAKKLMRTY